MLANIVKHQNLPTPIPLQVLLIIITIVLSCRLPGTILSALAPSPLEQQRQKRRAPRASSPIPAGRVMSVQTGVIYPSITPYSLAAVSQPHTVIGVLRTDFRTSARTDVAHISVLRGERNRP